MPDFQTNSARWAIFDLVASRLEQAPELQGLPVARNPRTAQHLGNGEQLVVVKWGSDSLKSRNGGHPQRTMRLTVGAISRKAAGADRDADAIHYAAAQIVQQAMRELNSLEQLAKVEPKENDTTPDLEGIELVGAVVLSAWEIDYQLRRVA